MFENMDNNCNKKCNNCKYCYVIGPTGPTGPAGPVNVSVGETITGNYDEKAYVENVGDKENIILNFTIPRGQPGFVGEKGDKGDKGERGDKGEKGDKGDKGEIGPMGPTGRVGEPGIPGEKGLQGDIGPTGPTGPSSGINAYGERYSNTPQIIPLTQDIDAIVPLEQTGPSLLTSYTDNHSITVNKEGLYLVLYYLSGAPSMDGNLTVSIKSNGNKIPGSDVNSEGISNYFNQISGSLLTKINEGDELSLSVKCNITLNLTFNGSSNARIIIIKLD